MKMIQQRRIYLTSLVVHIIIFTENITKWMCIHIQICSGNNDDIHTYFRSCFGNSYQVFTYFSE